MRVIIKSKTGCERGEKQRTEDSKRPFHKNINVLGTILATIKTVFLGKCRVAHRTKRFCDLAHLVRRCFNTLREVGVPSDMDNSHMLSIIEQKNVR